MTLHESRAAAALASERLKVYAQPQRLMILSSLLGGEHTVGGIKAATGIGQPALSQQLAELRRAEVVKTRRSSKQIYYSLANSNVATCVRGINAMFGASGDATSVVHVVSANPPQPPLLFPKVAAVFAQVR